LDRPFISRSRTTLIRCSRLPIRINNRFYWSKIYLHDTRRNSSTEFFISNDLRLRTNRPIVNAKLRRRNYDTFGVNIRVIYYFIFGYFATLTFIKASTLPLRNLGYYRNVQMLYLPLSISYEQTNNLINTYSMLLIGMGIILIKIK